MKNKHFLPPLFMLLSLVVTPMFAQADKKVTSKPKTWAQEPSSILGVKLGAPLSQSQLPSCSQDRKAGDTVICLSEKQSPLPGYPPLRTIEGHPFGYATFSIKVDDTGTVSTITARMDHHRFADFVTVLKEKYGAPTLSYAAEAQSRGGATYPDFRIRWAGQRVSISALERFETIDRSAVIFTDNASNNIAREAKDEATKTHASKL